MAMAVAIDTAHLALDVIPRVEGQLDRATGGRGRFQIHRVSAYATILFPDSEIWRQSRSALHGPVNSDISLPKQEVLDWQAEPDDDLGDGAVLHHLHQQAATVPLLSSVISQGHHGNAATTLTGSALSANINSRTQGRLLSSFHRYSFRQSCLGLWESMSRSRALVRRSDRKTLFPSGLCIQDQTIFDYDYPVHELFKLIVWAGPPRANQFVFWQLQWDMVDLFSQKTLPRPGKRQRTAFNQFLQVSDSSFVEDTSRGNPLPHARRFNGVRHRPDRRTWVAEMKPPKHKTKQDFGNFKSEAEAARAVDAAFHHYSRPDLLNFPDTSLQFLSTRPTAPPGLDEKAKVKFVKEEAKLLLAAIAASSPLHCNHTNSLRCLELSASPRRCPSGQFRSFSEISLPFSCSGPDEVDDVVSQPQPWMLLDSICDISTIGVQTNLETLNSVQNAEQGWDGAEYSSTLAAPPNVVNPSAYKTQSMWLDTPIRSPSAPTYSRSPSPSHSQEEIAYALLEHQSIWVWSDDDILYEKVEDTIGSTNFEHM